MMKESNYWQQFLGSGKVEDYLHYRMNADGYTNDRESALYREGAFPVSSHPVQETDRTKGRATDAGLCGSDRDRFEG